MKSTVLLVEDDADDLFLFQNALAKVDAEVNFRFVRDGEEAEAYLSGTGEAEDRRPVPDLILLDLKLPRLSGLEFLQRRSWASGGNRIPVVVFTSSREPSDVENAYALGASRYLVKPPNFRGLTEVIRAISVYLSVVRRDPNTPIERNGVPWPSGTLQKPPPS